MEIKKIEQLIKTIILNDDITYLKHQCKPLLAVGENYGSTMLDVQIFFRKYEHKDSILHCIAKTCPPRSWIWVLFNTPVTFKKEIGMYLNIIPRLTNFCREYGLDLNCYAECFGARISADQNAEEVDQDATILLQNIKYEGYNVLDRFDGFDFDCTKAVIEDLAVYHAVPIAYKQKSLESFEKILPHLKKAINFTFPEEKVHQTCEKLKTFLDTKNTHLFPNLKEAFFKVLNFAKPESNTNKLFQTITHNDMWVNNIMTKIENNNITNKFVDFQGVEHASLANDLIFFLYSSVQIPILQEYCDYFLKLYYEKFIKTLQMLNCDIVGYKFDEFLNEIHYVAANYQFYHIVCMLVPIYTLRGKAKDLTEFSSMDDFEPHQENLHENYTRKLNFVIEDFVRRKWI